MCVCKEWLRLPRGGGDGGLREALFLRLWVNYDNMGIEERKVEQERHRSEGKIKCAKRGLCWSLTALEGGGATARRRKQREGRGRRHSHGQQASWGLHSLKSDPESWNSRLGLCLDSQGSARRFVGWWPTTKGLQSKAFRGHGAVKPLGGCEAYQPRRQRVQKQSPGPRMPHA